VAFSFPSLECAEYLDVDVIVVVVVVVVVVDVLVAR
jgi:hypothetical protein